MAEAYTNLLGKDWMEALSAGIEPQETSDIAVKVMAEDGIDISHQQAKVLHKDMLLWADLVVTFDSRIEDEYREFPSIKCKKNWDITGPAIKKGSEEECEVNFRIVRDEIKSRVSSMLGGMKMMTH